ncbi:MAG: hypothetical protein WC401_03635 [Bacteroidales bacterium]|nr:hypothetical protein [Bacteroidales bacterium]
MDIKRQISKILQKSLEKARVIIVSMKGFEFSFSSEKDMKQIENDIDQLLNVLFYGIVPRSF